VKFNLFEKAKEDAKLLVLKRVQTLKNIDGTIIDESILEKVR
jgi:dynein light chain 1